MTERLLKKRELAAMLGTSPGVAVSIMPEHRGDNECWEWADTHEPEPAPMREAD